MDKDLKISIGIPTLNRRESLKACLDSLRQQTYKNFEVIISDGGSTDGTKRLLDEYSDCFPVQFIVNKKGLVPSINAALEVSDADIFTRIDDDVVIHPLWLQKIVSTFNLSSDIGGVTGEIVIPEDRIKDRDLITFVEKMRNPSNLLWKLLANFYFGFFLEGKPFAICCFFRSGAFSLGGAYLKNLNLKDILEVEYLEPTNYSCRRELIEKVGGFDEKYTGVGEYHEPDVCFKIRKLGYRLIFNPEVILEHHFSKAGVFNMRASTYSRTKNFIHFYFQNIKPNTLDKFIRFYLYLMFINTYWFFKFLTSGNIKQLSGITGTIVGIWQNSRIGRLK